MHHHNILQWTFVPGGASLHCAMFQDDENGPKAARLRQMTPTSLFGCVNLWHALLHALRRLLQEIDAALLHRLTCQIGLHSYAMLLSQPLTPALQKHDSNACNLKRDRKAAGDAVLALQSELSKS